MLSAIRMRARCGGVFCFLAAIGALAAQAGAVEVEVKNDSVIDGSTAVIQAGFIAGESAAAWLTAPCDGNIVAVQVFWRSMLGNQPQSVEDSISIFAAGTFPTPGSLLINATGESALLLGPVMTDGVLNEFRFLDENQTIPLSVPVTTGQVFVVSFKFFNTPPGTGPSVVTDADGCQTGKNGIFAIPGGWLNVCALGVSGDFMIRAIVDCGTITGACCDANAVCTDGVSQSNCQAPGDTFFANQTCAQVTCPPPTGACCLPGSAGCNVQSDTDCLIAGGTYLGNGVPCTPDPCLQACCVPEPGTFCVDEYEDPCVGLGGEPQGFGTFCAGGGADVCPLGACCLTDGTCVDNIRPADCTAQGGTFKGDGTLCSGVQCQPPTGACCLTGGGCQDDKTQQVCEAFGNTWAGPGTTCADACCAGADGDMLLDTLVNGRDIQVFVDAMLGTPTPDEICHGDFDGDLALGINDVPGMVAALLAGP